MAQTNPKGMMAQGVDPAKGDPSNRPDVAPTSEDIFRERSKSKSFKIASVIVYCMAVFGNGFMLCVFFLFIWDPQIEATRPANMAPDKGLLGRFGPHHDRLVADNDGIHAQRLKNPKLPTVPYRRIMSEEFTNNYIKLHHIHNGGNSDIPEAPRALPLYAQEEYGNKGSTVKPASNSPRVTRSTNMHDYNIGSEEGIDSTSSYDGGPMAKPKMTGSAITSH